MKLRLALGLFVLAPPLGAAMGLALATDYAVGYLKETLKGIAK